MKKPFFQTKLKHNSQTYIFYKIENFFLQNLWITGHENIYTNSKKCYAPAFINGVKEEHKEELKANI